MSCFEVSSRQTSGQADFAHCSAEGSFKSVSNQLAPIFGVTRNHSTRPKTELLDKEAEPHLLVPGGDEFPAPRRTRGSRHMSSFTRSAKKPRGHGRAHRSAGMRSLAIFRRTTSPVPAARLVLLRQNHVVLQTVMLLPALQHHFGALQSIAVQSAIPNS
jgi:hypothetical protein